MYIYLDIIKRMVFVMETEHAYSEVGTDFYTLHR
jgi:hypothetical protein